MPFTTATPAHRIEKQFPKRRRFQITKIATACLLGFVLMYVGYKGKYHAGLQAKLNEIVLVRDQLQRKLDDEQLVARIPGSITNANWPPLSDRQIAALVSALKTRVWQFDADNGPAGLSDIERLDLRLSEATLANAETRFADALATITARDENAALSTSEFQIARMVRVLQIRADSFYGLHQWQDALDRYPQVLTLQPNHLVALLRAAECQYALGKTNDALTTYAHLAKKCMDRANTLRLLGKSDAATTLYSKAKEYEARSKP